MRMVALHHHDSSGRVTWNTEETQGFQKLLEHRTRHLHRFRLAEDATETGFNVRQIMLRKEGCEADAVIEKSADSNQHRPTPSRVDDQTN